MPKESYSKEELMKYRLETAEQMLADSEMLLRNDSFKGSLNRSYYAMFTSIRALLALDGKDFKSHGDVIGEFNRTYIKSGILETKFSKYIQKAFLIRNNADYQDFYIVTKTDTKTQLNNAQELLETISQYVTKNVKKNSNEKNTGR